MHTRCSARPAHRTTATTEREPAGQGETKKVLLAVLSSDWDAGKRIEHVGKRLVRIPERTGPRNSTTHGLSMRIKTLNLLQR